MDRICDYFEHLDERPVAAQVERGYLAKALPAAAPEHGEPWDAIERDYHEHVLRGMTHWQHPAFYAFFPSNVTYEGILANMYGAAISTPGFNWAAAPVVTELEFLVMDWVAKMLGLGPAFHSNDSSNEGGGVIIGGASEAALTVAIAARERALSAHSSSQPADDDKVPEWRGDLSARLIVYGTTQTHSIASKAAMMLGLQFRALEVRREDAYGLRGATLQAALDEDHARGMIPFLLVATYGTTSSCAVDNLAEIVPIVERDPDLWLHIDAAYAGVTLALPEERPQETLDAINRGADSFGTNLHKGGLVHMECSPLFVRDRRWLSRALSVTPEYLRTRGIEEESVEDLRNMQIVLGRSFRALKVWFVLRSYGQEGFREHVRRNIRLAGIVQQQLVQHPALEIAAPPRWGLVMFRVHPRDAQLDEQQLDALNQRFAEALGAQNDKLMLTPTRLPELGYCIRLVVGSPHTREHHVRASVDVIHQCADQVLRTGSA